MWRNSSFLRWGLNCPGWAPSPGLKGFSLLSLLSTGTMPGPWWNSWPLKIVEVRINSLRTRTWASFIYLMLGIKPRVSCILGKHFTMSLKACHIHGRPEFYSQNKTKQNGLSQCLMPIKYWSVMVTEHPGTQSKVMRSVVRNDCLVGWLKEGEPIVKWLFRVLFPFLKGICFLRRRTWKLCWPWLF